MDELDRHLLGGKQGEPGGKTSRGNSSHSRHSMVEDRYENTKVDKDGNLQNEFKTTWYRWVIIFVFDGISLNLPIIVIGYSAFLTSVQTAYNLPS